VLVVVIGCREGDHDRSQVAHRTMPDPWRDQERRHRTGGMTYPVELHTALALEDQVQLRGPPVVMSDGLMHVQQMQAGDAAGLVDERSPRDTARASLRLDLVELCDRRHRTVPLHGAPGKGFPAMPGVTVTTP
jgi:hypothetical protein